MIRSSNKQPQVHYLKNLFRVCISLFTVCSVLLSCQPKEPAGFIHKGYLGWFIDLSTTYRPGRSWPSIEIDSALLRDYEKNLDFLQSAGMNEITVWGLFTGTSWEPVIENTIDEKRALLVRQIIDKAHQRGIKIISGMGVYSWGFNKIIEQYPEVKCACNNELMDLSKPQAWQWQKKVIDHIMDNYDFDGMSLQSADHGICKCGDYSSVPDMEYHALVNQKVIGYIRSKKEDYIIGISGWGMDLSDSSDLASIVKMTRNTDYLIDVYESALRPGKEYRKKLIEAIAPCAYGNTGTPNVEPIMALPRNYYLVPTTQRTGKRIKDLYNNGGRACEMYYRTFGNPGDALTAEVSARLLSDPSLDLRQITKETLSGIYKANDDQVLEELTDIFFEAEDAYFTCAVGDQEIILLIPRDATSPSIQYFAEMSLQCREIYKTKIEELHQRALALSGKIPDTDRYKELLNCFETVLMQMDSIRD